MIGLTEPDWPVTDIDAIDNAQRIDSGLQNIGQLPFAHSNARRLSPKRAEAPGVGAVLLVSHPAPSRVPATPRPTPLQFPKGPADAHAPALPRR
jgi:hypothetical protein